MKCATMNKHTSALFQERAHICKTAAVVCVDAIFIILSYILFTILRLVRRAEFTDTNTQFSINNIKASIPCYCASEITLL